MVAQEGVYVKKGDLLAKIKSEKTSLVLEQLRNEKKGNFFKISACRQGI